MSHDLGRFLDAQRSGYDGIVRELRAGSKTGHWIWFVFPQVAGLGRSGMNALYAISGLDEARAYLAHTVLGSRLRECAEIVAASDAPSAESIFGGLDALKVRSSMTLFLRADPSEPAFLRVLDRYYGGEVDARTDELLGIRPG